MKTAKIAKLRIKTENGEEEVSSLSLIANLGISGDKKANGGDRQLCLADEKTLSEYRSDNVGLCVKRFMPNITTSNLNYADIKPGTVLKIDDAVIEISSYEKKCFPECELVKQGKICQIRKNSAFAKIITSGTVHSK